MENFILTVIFVAAVGYLLKKAFGSKGFAGKGGCSTCGSAEKEDPEKGR